MSGTNGWADVAVGHYLNLIRRDAGLTQAQVANKLPVSPASVSRIESGEADVTPDELTAILDAIDTQMAQEFGEYLSQKWDELERPAFDHPNRKTLWEANLALRKLRELRDNPDLKSVFIRQIEVYDKELRRNAAFLYSREHQVAFIGKIAVGKTTAICKLVGLLKPGENKLDRESVLETGGGRTTLCEVHIAQGPKYGLRIVPRTEDSIRKDVEEYAEYLAKSVRPDNAPAKATPDDDGEAPGASEEVARAIRNMAGLTPKFKDEGGKKVRVFPAKELAVQYPKSAELSIQILTRMDLLRRTRRDVWYPDDCPQPPTQWLQQVFSDVNNGRHLDFTLPQKIEVVIPDPVFASEDLPLKVIDTKGIDQTAERQDLECHFDDRRTLVVLCSSFFDAPDLPVQTLLQRAKEAGIRDFGPKTVILALPRPEEALAVKHDDGSKVETEEEGYERKREQIDMPLQQQGVSDVSIMFFNSKDNDPTPIRDGLVRTIKQFRGLYCDRITKLSQEVDRLIENQENEEIRLVFEEVARHLSTWLEKNAKLEVDETPVQAPLVTAIDHTRYASTVRAAVRRYGDWYNLDYFHHLAVGARRLAVTLIGARVQEFKVIVNNLIDNAELAPARAFMGRVIDSLDAAADASYRKTQVAGREAFKSELEDDFEFWGKCEERWGAERLVRGGKYRDEIRDITAEQLASSYDDAHQVVKNLIADEWKNIVGLLRDMLRQGEGQSASTAASR